MEGREPRASAVYNPPPQLTMPGNDVHINHRTTQLLEHLDHRALA